MQIELLLRSWLPDLPELNNPGLTTAFNVVPGFGPGQGAVTYQPMNAATLYSATAMESRPLGTAIGFDTLGNAKVYGGSAAKLYKVDPADRAWRDVSRPSGYSTGQGENWNSTEYGNAMFFTNFNDEMQFINKDLDLQFGDVTTLVKARHIATVKDYIVVGNTYDELDGAMPFRVRWSGLGLPLSWEFSQSTGADFQDVYGYGSIQGIVGGEAGWLLMKKGIVKMTFVGFPFWFQFDPVPNSKGCAVPQSVVTVEGNTYFVSDDGFYVMNGNTGQTIPIGVGKIDQFFLNSADTSQYSQMTVATDPRSKLIYWAYMTKDAVDGVPDRMLIYNYVTGDWSHAEASANFVFNALSLPWTVDQLDIFGSIDAIPASLDSPIWAGGNAMLWAMDASGAIYVFGGQSMPAVIETGEIMLAEIIKAADPKASADRATVRKIRPLYHGETGVVRVRVGQRSTTRQAVSWQPQAELNAETQTAYVRSCDRFHRFRLNLSGGWAKVMSVQIDADPAGSR